MEEIKWQKQLSNKPTAAPETVNIFKYRSSQEAQEFLFWQNGTWYLQQTAITGLLNNQFCS